MERLNWELDKEPSVVTVKKLAEKICKKCEKSDEWFLNVEYLLFPETVLIPTCIFYILIKTSVLCINFYTEN